MWTQKQMLENRNYYNDSRVQSSMFSSCWKIVHQEERKAILSFDEDWIVESLQVERLEAIARQWIEDEEAFTQEYRELFAVSQAKKKTWEDEKQKLVQAYVYLWKAPKEERERVNNLYRAWNESSRVGNQAFNKIYERAEKENGIEKLAEEMGFAPYKEYRFCLRAQTKFEVCSQCEGSGVVVNPNIDCCGLTEEDFYEDPDFAEDYLSGRFDVACPRCDGLRVEAIPQFPTWLNDAIESYNKSQWDGIREQCAELAMGA